LGFKLVGEKQQVAKPKGQLADGFSTNKLKSYLLVTLQLACIGIIAFSGPFFPKNIFFLSIGILGALLGLWAIFKMELGRFNITPDVHKNSRMVAKGPYKYIRHPMYVSVLLVTLAWVLNYFTLFRFGIWIVLLIDLLLKMTFEERLLSEHYEQYQDYRKRTKKLIPRIF
jgi:protein-S-isoprenylcysteine O-methyltransferase Ste14